MIGKLLLRRRGNMVRPLVTETGGLVQCRPVPDSLLCIKSYFSPVETPPTEGDKSPTNPSTISGWESVEVTRCGENLSPVTANLLGKYYGAYTLVEYDGRQCIKFVPTDAGYYRLAPYYEFELPLPSKLEQGITVSFEVLFDETAILNRVHAYSRIKAIPSVTCYQNMWTKISCYFTYGDLIRNHALLIFPTMPSGGNPYTELYISNLQYSVGTTLSPYTPYQGNTYTATLPSEIGGGYVDWERGVLVKEWETRVLDGSETYSGGIITGTTKFRFWTSNTMNGGPKNTLVDQMCNRLPISTAGLDTYTFSSGICVFKENNTIYGYIEGLSTIDEVVDFISDNNIVIAYKLATPVETPLSDLPAIYAIDGINTIYSNAGDVEVTYKGAR